MNPIEPIKVVSAKDPALDLAEMDLRKYLETRDLTLVRSIAGKRPVHYELRPLHLPDVEFVTSLPPTLQARAAFEAAIVAIDGLDVLAPGGSVWRPRKEVEDALGQRRAVPTREEMNELFHVLPNGLDTIQEIGLVALERATQGNGRRGAPRFTVPPLFSPEVTRSERLRAERSRTSSGTPSTESSSSA